MAIRRAAIVVPGLVTSGGVPAVAAFLYQVMVNSGKYQPHLFSLSTSSRDKHSLRLLKPGSWFQGPTIGQGIWNGQPYQHVGAIWTEIEFQRYQPRRLLTKALSGFDLVQVVAGSPAWAYVTRDLQQPVFLQVATLAAVERQAILREISGTRRVWLKAMTKKVSQIEERALGHLSAVFVENTWMFEHLRKKMDPSRVIFAPPGVDLECFRSGKYQANSYILSVGRLRDPRKNVPLLFKAYSRLLKELPTAPKLVLVGKSVPHDSTWQLAKSLGIARQIKVLRDVSTAELADIYRKASLFVLSSDEEGLGIVILEAMASSIPVVATRCGGPETAVVDSHTGYLVPTGDAEALALRMQHLLENPDEAERFGQAGRKKAEEEFSLETAGRGFLQQYDKAFL